MAVVSGGVVGNYLRRQGNLPTWAASSLVGWFKIPSDTDNFQAVLQFGTGGFFALRIKADGVTAELYNEYGSHGGDGPVLTMDAWYGVTSVSDGSDHTIKIINADGSTAISWSGAIDSWDSSGMELWLNGYTYGTRSWAKVAGWKMFAETRSDAELLDELFTRDLVDSSNCRGWWPMDDTSSLANNLVDEQGLGNLVQAGTASHTVDSDLPPWEASEIVGDLSATLAAATLSAAGQVEIKGALSKTLAAATLSATGTSPRNAALNATLAAATLSATGQRTPIDGELAVTLAPATLSAAGTNDLEAAAATTLAAATLAATGTLDIVGQVAATLAAATLASEATSQSVIVGDMSATLQPATLSASGTVDIAAALGVTLQDAILVSGAALEIKGALVATLAPATLEATGQETDEITGELAATLAPATLVAAALVFNRTPVYPAALTPADVQQYLQERWTEPRRDKPLSIPETIYWSQRADARRRRGEDA